MTKTSNFDLLLRLYEHLISFIHPFPDWILIFCFLITNVWFHSFALSQIEFCSSASLLWTLDVIPSPCPRLNFYLPLRYYEHFFLFIYPVPDWILIFHFAITNTWFHSFTLPQIGFWSSTSSLRTFDFIHSPCPRLKFDLLLCYYEYLLSYILPVPDWILVFCFVITNT